MDYTNTLTLEEKISYLEHKYAALFERNASREALYEVWKQIRLLQALRSERD